MRRTSSDGEGMRRRDDARRPCSIQRSLCENSLQMKTASKNKAILTDSHFLIPLIVFCIGLALLIALH